MSLTVEQQIKNLNKEKSLLIERDCETLCENSQFTEDGEDYCCIHEKQMIDIEIQTEKLMNENPHIYSTKEQIIEIRRLFKELDEKLISHIQRQKEQV